MRENLEKKWWHRFAKVLLIASTMTVGGFVLYAGFTNITPWEDTYAYSFQQGYADVRGTAWLCSYTTTPYLHINCGGLTSSDILVLPIFAGYGPKVEEARRQGGGNAQILQTILENDEKVREWFNSITYKKNIAINYPGIAGIVLGALVATSVWFVVLRSVTYKVILYIVFGNKLPK